MNNLKDILPDKLKQGLTPAEEGLLAVATEDEEKDYSTRDEEANNPENAESWGPERTLRAELLCWLCTDAKAAKIIHAKGIRIKGAKINGNLDFEAASLSHPLEMICCAIGDISFNGAEAKKLNFSESHINLFSAGNLTVRGNVLLRDVKAKSGVNMLGANIGGNLSCNGATFENPEGDAFMADRLTVKGSVFLREGFKAKGGVRLLGASIGSDLDCTGATLENPEGDAFMADGLAAKGSVFLDGITAKGRVRLLGADIGDTLDCNGATFENPAGTAFNADRLAVKGSVFLREGVTAKGGVRLLGANIGSNLECDGATFENPGGYAFGADGLVVKGDVFLREGFKAKGEVRLLGANIGGDLDCTGATLENPEGHAFSADRLTAKGSVFLSDVTAKGEVRLPGANVGGSLFCNGATLENPAGTAFNAENASINGTLFFAKTTIADGALNLGHAHVGQLVDDKASWPGQGELILNGFEYEALAGDNTPKSAKERIAWLRLQPQNPFYTQPYEHLAKVFRQIGHETDARSVLIAKQDDLRKYGALGFWATLWNGFLGFAVGHGYKPLQVIIGIIIPMLLLGVIIFSRADIMDIMQPSKERVYLDKAFIETEMPPSRYPVFNPWAYSLDVFVPFVDLHQENYWLPDATRPNGCWFRIYLWVHIALGWMFSTLAAVSLAGLVRKE